jgi:hypothetical protein
VPTELACVDTREHASELVSWREMASGLFKSGGREVDTREKADELASWRRMVSERFREACKHKAPKFESSETMCIPNESDPFSCINQPDNGGGKALN